MSSDIGNALGSGLALYPNDLRACSQEFFHNEELYQPPPLADLLMPQEVQYEGTAGGFPGYMSPWWPRSGAFVGDLGVDISTLGLPAAYGPPGPTPPTGCNGRLAFVGYTRDQYGSPLGGCTVRCFRKSTDLLVSKVVSDANGYYIATSPFNDAHILVIHDATGALAGASVDTLIPA